MILAQYTIRSKQNYIFKTNRVLEIVGASEHIAGIWEELFKVADTISLKFQRTDTKFSLDSITKAFDEKELDFVELFSGGGNETILFGSEDAYRRLNRAFSYKLLTGYPGMIPMAVSVAAEGNYSADYASLMKASETKKEIMELHWDMFTVPFAMMDRSTFQPYSTVRKIGNSEVRMSDESSSKYETGIRLRNKNSDIRLFDEMISKKGKESLLAVVHCDGNNMGMKIMDMLHGEKSYDRAVEFMREFTRATADCFETHGEAALNACRKELEEKNKKRVEEGKLKKSSFAYRRIIGSGDDVTFLCNARFVMDYVKAYLDSVQHYGQEKNCKWNYSSCAGICIFHSHYPFSRAYAIAEQACDDGAKKKIHITSADASVLEQGWMDFHFIHSGIGGDLEEIRRSQGTRGCIARPWLVSGNDANAVFTYDRLLGLRKIVSELGVSRSSIKTVGSAYERSAGAAKKELVHLYGHTEGLEERMKELFKKEEDRLKALYDFSEIYDLWYGEVK